MKKISRRSFLAAAGLSVAALALTACGGSASSVASSVASSASSAAASTSAAAGELTTVEAGKLTMATNAAFPPYEMTTDAGEFDPEKFAKQAVLPNVKMIEIKMSQGAKPGHGGILPKEKITEQIAQVRGVPRDRRAISSAPSGAIARPSSPAARVTTRTSSSTV